MTDRITQCDVVDCCEDCPRYGDDCDGDKYLDRYPTMHEYAEGKRINPKLTDLISRADAIAYIDKIINSGLGRNKSLDYIHKYISALPSADAVSREEAIQAIDRCRERKNKEIEQLREFYSQKPTIPMFAESEEAYKAWTGEEMGKTSDLISRAEALAYPLSFDHYDKENGSREFICGVESYREYIQHLPSVKATENKYDCDLISRADVKKVLREDWVKKAKMPMEADLFLVFAMKDIDNLPSVSAERVGEWSEYKDEYHGGIMGNCSCCGKSTYNAISYDLNGNRYQYHYCPNCGAKMKGGAE